MRDLCAMYEVDPTRADRRPRPAPGLSQRPNSRARCRAGDVGVQHHRAHIASVLAERGAWDEPVLGFAFDGTGYGDDGTIWGGEVFSGSLSAGFKRVAHLRRALLPGGDAAARFPVQAAAGFLAGVDGDGLAFERAPFFFPPRFAQARELIGRRVRTFDTTSIGRLFDTVAALLGFTHEQTFEGQAAIWLEHLARSSPDVAPLPLPYADGELDYRPLLETLIAERLAGRDPAALARAFHAALAAAIVAVARGAGAQRVVASGGVFQNALLLEMTGAELGDRLWTNAAVPPNDGGLSLGQAALAAFPRE